MTVDEEVLQVIIDYLEIGTKKVPIHLVEQAHPIHKLSGRARLRDLRKRGIVNYRYDKHSNCYIILSSLQHIISEAKKYRHNVRAYKVKESPPPQIKEDEKISKEDFKKIYEILGGE